MAVAFRRLLSVIVCLAVPSILKPWLLRRLGHPISSGAKIGVSLVLVDRLAMATGSSIGHSNIIIARRITMREGARISLMNIIKHNLSLSFAQKAMLGNRNKILRGWTPSPKQPAIFQLGQATRITSEHYFELTESIKFGDFSQVAGVGSQFWTHGYIHESTGIGRYLITGPIQVGSNVYIGSGCIINCGIRIVDAANVGAGACVAKSLDKPGVYVSQPLRYVDRRPEERLAGLQRVEGASAVDLHYRRLP